VRKPSTAEQLSHRIQLLSDNSGQTDRQRDRETYRGGFQTGRHVAASDTIYTASAWRGYHHRDRYSHSMNSLHYSHEPDEPFLTTTHKTTAEITSHCRIRLKGLAYCNCDSTSIWLRRKMNMFIISPSREAS